MLNLNERFSVFHSALFTHESFDMAKILANCFALLVRKGTFLESSTFVVSFLFKTSDVNYTYQENVSVVSEALVLFPLQKKRSFENFP